jgi:hypothetical protein
MAKRKRTARKRSPPAADAGPRRAPDPPAAAAGDSQLEPGNLSLHDLFQQQIRTMLEGTDLDEEAKLGILVAASCPCCGAGGMSFTAKIKRRT